MSKKIFVTELVTLLFALVMGIFMQIFMSADMYDAIDGQMEYFSSAMMYLVLFYFMIPMLLGWTEGGKAFNMHIGMGETRKHFFWTSLLRTYVFHLVLWLVFIGLSFLEKVIVRGIYPGIVIQPDFSSLLLELLPIAPLLVTGAEMFLMILAIKLGQAAKFVFLGVIIVFAISMNLVVQNIGAFVGLHISPIALMIAAGLLPFVLVAVARLLIRKQAVKL